MASDVIRARLHLRHRFKALLDTSTVLRARVEST